MAQMTPNYHLYLDDDNSATFLGWRERMNGPDDSNMMRIDAALAGKKESGWAPFYAGATAPNDTTQLWIDTTPGTGGLKYYDGSGWVAVPVIWG